MRKSSRKRNRRAPDVINTEASSKIRKTDNSNVSQDDRPNDVSPPLHTIFDLIEARANESELGDQPIVFYPSSGTNYVGYSAVDIRTLTLKAAAYYNTIVPQRTSSDEAPTVVALLGPSDLDYLIGMLALSSLGHTILFLSPRISEEAHVSLLTVCKAKHLLVHEAFKTISTRICKRLTGLKRESIASRNDYEVQNEAALPLHQRDPVRERQNDALIIHSSGSTSLPKPNYQTHGAALDNFKSQFSLVGFITLPLYHMQGIGCVFRSVMNRKPIYMYNASLPLTNRHLTATLENHPDIQILYGVPYVMKLLADSDEGIALCRNLEVLFCGGGACPKPVGDKLVRNGVYLVSHVGTSETGQLMNSYRPRSEIEEWDWLRPSTTLQKYLRWEPYDAEKNIYEMVVLDGWPSKVASNGEDGSYATKDLWERHPEYPGKNAWRYYSRKDDTIVLSNGEKANPILFENNARESPKVKDAIVFGSQKPHLGMFVLPADESFAYDDIMDEIWPAVQEANDLAPAHAHLSKEMIRLLRPDISDRVKRTDKSSIIRPAFYKEFSTLIDAIYDESATSGTLQLDEDELRAFLTAEVKELVQAERSEYVEPTLDLFSLGLDSLQASRMRSTILRQIDIGDNNLGENFVFDFPSIDAMTAELLRLRDDGPTDEKRAVEQRMEEMIKKYTIDFPRHMPTPRNAGEHIVVTGATGSLGAHVVAQLSGISGIQSITCLVRARSNDEASSRVQKSLHSRMLRVEVQHLRCIAVDFKAPLFGLSDEDYSSLSKNVTCVMHSAWNVNFNMGLQSLELDCLKGTKGLIDLCLKAKRARPASFVFCSSISTVANSPEAEIVEDAYTSLEFAQNVGYAQSKLVAENVCLLASSEAGLPCRVLRIGQIVGDTTFGIWDRQKAVPLIIRSACTIGALPTLDEECSWLPVDVVATAVIDSWLNTQADQGPLFDVHNVVNRNTFHWTKYLLPMLKKTQLDFQAVDPAEWLRRIRANPDLQQNPPYKLINFFTARYGSEQTRKRLSYRTEKSRAASRALREIPKMDQSQVDKFVKYITAER